MAYKSIHTATGLALMADAETSGIPIILTEIAVGDGNGNPVTLDMITEDRTSLYREVYRGSINRVYPDENDPLLRYAELVIPVEEGGFTIREVGVFTGDGDMYVVGNIPETYKPEEADGSFSDTVIKVAFRVTNADVLTLVIDPSAITVTQSWIENNVNACYILPGGTTGQILKKTSNDCGDVEWADADAIEVIVDAIEEKQTLAASQTTVIWSTVTTVGLAVYIEGVRIPRGAGVDEWLPADAPDELTNIVLGKDYPAGSIIVGVQNDPAGNVGDPLQAYNNLSDVDDAGVSRNNLDVYSKAETDQKAPPGLVASFARNTAPTGWLKANGAAVSRTTYATLFAAIGTTFGVGDGFTTFNLPDMRGEFVRGWDDARGVDASRVFGSTQKASLLYGERVNNTVNTISNVEISKEILGWDNVLVSNYSGATATRVAKGGNGEMTNNHVGGARPRNTALLYCIKF